MKVVRLEIVPKDLVMHACLSVVRERSGISRVNLLRRRNVDMTGET